MNTPATCPQDRPAASPKHVSQDAILETPLRWLIGHKPGLFQLDAIPAEARNTKSDVRVTDLWGQLSRGKISTTYSRLMANIPAAYIRADAALAPDELVDLPLNEIVGALGPAALEKMRPAAQTTVVDDIPDLFEFTAPRPARPAPEPTPPVVAQSPEDTPDFGDFDEPMTRIPPPETGASEGTYDSEDLPDLDDFDAPTAMFPPAEEPVQPAPHEVAASAAPSRGRSLLLQDVNLNTATIEELVANVVGLNHHIAHQIVLSRDREGLYVCLQDLARVSGIGPAIYRRLTGQAWPGSISNDRTAAVALLGLGDTNEVSLRQIVQRFRERKGFEGCMIVNSDGETLAESWGHRTSEALAAFVSHTMKRMTPHIHSMGVQGADFMTVSLNGRPFTMVQVDEMTFIAVHEAGRFTQRQVRFVQQVGNLLRDVLGQ